MARLFGLVMAAVAAGLAVLPIPATAREAAPAVEERTSEGEVFVRSVPAVRAAEALTDVQARAVMCSATSIQLTARGRHVLFDRPQTSFSFPADSRLPAAMVPQAVVTLDWARLTAVPRLLARGSIATVSTLPDGGVAVMGSGGGVATIRPGGRPMTFDGGALPNPEGAGFRILSHAVVSVAGVRSGGRTRATLSRMLAETSRFDNRTPRTVIARLLTRRGVSDLERRADGGLVLRTGTAAPTELPVRLAARRATGSRDVWLAPQRDGDISVLSEDALIRDAGRNPTLVTDLDPLTGFTADATDGVVVLAHGPDSLRAIEPDMATAVARLNTLLAAALSRGWLLQDVAWDTRSGRAALAFGAMTRDHRLLTLDDGRTTRFLACSPAASEETGAAPAPVIDTPLEMPSAPGPRLSLTTLDSGPFRVRIGTLAPEGTPRGVVVLPEPAGAPFPNPATERLAPKLLAAGWMVMVPTPHPEAIRARPDLEDASITTVDQRIQALGIAVAQFARQEAGGRPIGLVVEGFGVEFGSHIIAALGDDLSAGVVGPMVRNAWLTGQGLSLPHDGPAVSLSPRQRFATVDRWSFERFGVACRHPRVWTISTDVMARLFNMVRQACPPERRVERQSAPVTDPVAVFLEQALPESLRSADAPSSPPP
jgi:hypothetical protein